MPLPREKWFRYPRNTCSFWNRVETRSSGKSWGVVPIPAQPVENSGRAVKFGSVPASLTRFAHDYGATWAVYASWTASNIATIEVFNRLGCDPKNRERQKLGSITAAKDP
jgi:hypothetical protein